MTALLPQYNSLQSVSENVRRSADAEAQQSIADELASIDTLWLNTDLQLTDQLQKLESASRQWGEVETGMESILCQLKKTHTLLKQPLSVNYDELERELQHCQVSNVCSQNWFSFISCNFVIFTIIL